MAQQFLENVYKLHRLPSSIVSDRDPIFMTNFWKELLRVLEVNLKHSSSYHPQTNSQTKEVNRCLETYLRCMSGDMPKRWCSWIYLAEFWYNTSYDSAIKITPFQALYGVSPPIHVPYIPRDSMVAAVDVLL